MSYQGPHAAVTQTFDSAPGAVAVEGLPAAIVGSSFELFSNHVIGELATASAETLGYGTTKDVVYGETVAGKRAYDFLKPRLEVSVGGRTVEVSATADANGFTINEKPTYEIGTADTATMPMCKTTASAAVTTSVKTINVGIDLRNYGIVAGQSVVSGSNLIGTIASISTDGMSVTLEANAAYAIANNGEVIFGVTASAPTVANTIKLSTPISGLQAGDIVSFKASVTGSEASYKASVVRIFDNGKAVEINTAATPTVDTNYTGITTLEGFVTASGGFTAKINTVVAKRLVAFAESIKPAGYAVAASGNKFTAVTATDATISTIATGDTVKYGTKYAKVTGVVVNGANTEIYIDKSDASGALINAFRTKIKATVRATFRAINIATTEVVQRIVSKADIETYYGRISPYNELAFMIDQARKGNGGKVVYARNVSPKLTESTSQYATAIEELKMFDVYSHAFGTTNFGIVGAIASYCNQQSEPYRAHERVARVVYDAESAYTILRKSTASLSTVTLAITGALSAGCGIGDVVVLLDNTGAEIARRKVVMTPTNSAVTVDSILASGTVDSAYILAGSKFKQAQQIAALASIDARRVKIMCPSYFAGTIDGTDFDALPPYFLSAYYAGLDDGLIVSQSHTNFGQAPGITNIALNTDTYFDVDMLDIIGAAGVDILIQDGIQVTNTIMSRHDLSTDMLDILTREWSVTKQVDLSAKTLRKIAKKYVGKYNITKPLLDTVTRELRIGAKTLVDTKVTANIVIVSVERSKEVADKVVIGVKQTVFIAGNYYDITINVGV